MALEGSKLSYFPIPGRAEAIRVALHAGGIKFTDERILPANWPALKPTTPFGSMPILTLADGTVLAQSGTLLRFVGKQTGHYPCVVAGRTSFPTHPLHVAVLLPFLACRDTLPGPCCRAHHAPFLSHRDLILRRSADPLAAARVDEIMDVAGDISTKINAVGRGMEQEAKNAERLKDSTCLLSPVCYKASCAPLHLAPLHPCACIVSGYQLCSWCRRC